MGKSRNRRVGTSRETGGTVKIKPGPRMREFAKAINTPIEEVVEFVNKSINDPDPDYLKSWPTEELRKQAIQDYMLWVIDYERELTLPTGINERIRDSL
jgi:hypothetical protein